MDRTGASEITTWKVILVFLLGAAVGFVVLFADLPSWDEGHRAAARSSAVVLWAMLMCTQTGFWLLALVWLRPTVRELPPGYRRANRNEIVGSTIAILVIVVTAAVAGIVRTPWPNYLPGHPVKLGVLTVLGGLVGLVAARGVWIAHGGLKLLARKDLGSEESLSTYLSIQDCVGRFLGTLGVILGILVLSTGAQRRAVLSYDPTTQYGFELVLAYGFLASILVAAVYLPTYLTLNDVGHRIRDAACPTLPPSDDDWAVQTEKREKLGQLLGLDQGPFSRLKTSAAILTPLLSSLVGLLLSAK
jgi:hypothetical protein